METEITLNEMLKKIESFSFLRECFSDYLKWLFEECDEERRRHDAIFVKVSKDQHNGLTELENIFRDFGKILDLNESDFCRIFRFDCDRNKNDILKIDDLLAEPWVALTLSKHGFQNIRKIPSETGKFADFIANHDFKKFAIEVKSGRYSEKEEYYKWLNNNSGEFLSSFHADGRDLMQHELERLKKGIEKRLQEPRSRTKIVEQLSATSGTYQCQQTMLVISVENLFVVQEFPENIMAILERVYSNYQVADYLACFVEREIYCTPQLF
jgi:hypothetical protein